MPHPTSPRLLCGQLYRQTGSAVYGRQSKERRLNLRRQGGAVRSQRIYILCCLLYRPDSDYAKMYVTLFDHQKSVFLVFEENPPNIFFLHVSALIQL